MVEFFFDGHVTTTPTDVIGRGEGGKDPLDRPSQSASESCLLCNYYIFRQWKVIHKTAFWSLEGSL